MIIQNKQGNDILTSGEKNIAFAVNTEGINDAGFAGLISKKYWPELANIGECKLGKVLIHKIDDGITLYALVCHSLENGWQNQTEVIRKCFNQIDCEHPIATISIGTGIVGILSGADFNQIKRGMELSDKKIILY